MSTYTQSSPPYNKENPYPAAVQKRQRLNRPGSSKETQHIVLNLEGSGITYKPGDSFAIYPKNDPQYVEILLQSLHASGEERVEDTRKGESLPLKNFLEQRIEISKLTKKMLSLFAEGLPPGAQRENLEWLLSSEQKQDLRDYLTTNELWNFTREYSSATVSPQEFCDLCSLLMPRFYSIASSQKAVGLNEVHFTIATFCYTINGHQRHGVCSHYLCERSPLHEHSIPTYLHATPHFALPEDPQRNLIMIGPGTGVAPYRGFMQERDALGSTAQHWLFFGERQRAYDFYYEDEWQKYCKKGTLRLDTAFSRDGKDKVYVQHKLQENAQELWRWLEEGAYFYVCGDAKRMAKDVHAALLTLVQEQGAMTHDQAKEYVKELKNQGRYQRDVY